VNRLQEQFGDEITFILLDVDDPASAPLRQQYSLTHRSNYLLVDGEGERVQSWFGPLSFDAVAADLATFLDTAP
jgi:hypothetical protein